MSAPGYSIARVVLRGLTFHARSQLAVLLGVAVGTAVLTGALIVGDSVRGSLQHLVLDGLGTIRELLIVDRFFEQDLTKHVSAQVEPIVYLQGAITQPDSGRRANQVALIGCDKGFPNLWPGSDQSTSREFKPFDGNDIVLNEPLASALGAKVGDDVLVRLPVPSEVPRDSPLGRKSETTSSRRVTVRQIVRAEGMGRFSLHPNQQQPLNAWLPRETLQSALKQDGKVNALLARDDHTKLTPRLADYGVKLRQTEQGYALLESERMLLDAPVEEAAQKHLAGQRTQSVLTYLANYITCGDNDRGKLAYSTVTALDVAAEPPLGPFKTIDGRVLDKIADDSIVLHRWAYDDLAAQGVQLKPGDEIRLTYFEPESTHGQVVEQTARFKLQAIIELEGAVNDRNFTPELKGVTDEASVADWNPPFPYDPKRVRSTKPNDQDEQYWDKYRATPKAFISLAAGRKLWSSRFGQTTGIRIALAPGESLDALATSLNAAIDPAKLGFTFRAIRTQTLAAASGTTPFNLLFLGFSMFLIAAAMMLVALLFRLGVERRAEEIGILRSVGWSFQQVRSLLLGEGAVVAVVGGLVGVALGVGYAWLMLAGLRTWWLSAITTPFLQLHVTSLSLILGLVCGVGASLGAIVVALRPMRLVSLRRLLGGEASEPASVVSTLSPRATRINWGLLVLAVIASLSAFQLSGEAQAGAFFGAGALILASLLGFVRERLRQGKTGSLVTLGPGAMARLALRNAARHSGRSTLTVGLMASACFLIVAISAFHLEPPKAPERRDTGTGGFTLLGESTAPLFVDLASEDGRIDLGFSAQDEKLLARCQVFPLRSQRGDDASCLNLYQPQQPRVLGASERLIERGGFEWAGHATLSPEDHQNPWRLLDRTLGLDEHRRGVVPVVIDMATAMFSLHLSGVGARYPLANDRGETITLEVVGLLKNSVLQGRLVISESHFKRHFPLAEGVSFFLIDAPTAQADQVEQLFEKRLDTFGFDVTPTVDRLAAFLAVQNTYLSTFQSLGGLGLLLGTLGLAVVQLRNVLERRGELALLQATGFRRALLARLILWENAALLLGGLGVGSASALVAIVPHLLAGGAAIPVADLAITLVLVVGVGTLAGMSAVRAVLKAPILAALRGE